MYKKAVQIKGFVLSFKVEKRTKTTAHAAVFQKYIIWMYDPVFYPFSRAENGRRRRL